MKKTLWTKNFILLNVGTVLGSIGSIAAGFALSFLVFDETGSTLAAALILAMEVVPAFIIPLIASPIMDRLPRKPFLVGGDAANGLLCALAGIYLMFCPFSYPVYLAFSLVISSIGAFDSLAYNAIYPRIITPGMEEKGYSVASMLYPILRVIMMPVAALLMKTIGVSWILIIQGALSIIAALMETQITITEENRLDGEKYTLSMWLGDIKEAAAYLKNEKGVRSIYNYMAVTNGMGSAYSPLIVAFFSVTAGLTTAMYSLFTVAEFLGRTIGGFVHYNIKIPPKKRFSFAFLVYMVYETMDMCLLWLPYPAMLINRGLCGFLGINSATMRQAAVQRYIPDSLRARLNAYENMLMQGCTAALSILVGALGEILDYRLCLSLCGSITMLTCLLTIWKNRAHVRIVYETNAE